MFRLNSGVFGIDQVQLDEISDLALGIFREISAIGSAPQLVYHYTDVIGLTGIIESSTIRGSHIAYMNDSQEYEYAVNILYKAWEVICRNVVDERQRIFLNYVEPYLKPGAMTLEYYFPAHIICFSIRKNDLSQWRAYGRGEGGFSIGFETSGLARMISARFAYTSSVIYDEKEHQRFAEELLQNTVCLYSKHACEQGSDSDGFLIKWYEAWRAAASGLAPLVKFPAFKEEKEWRIIVMATTAEDLIFRPRGSLLVPCIEVAASSAQTEMKGSLLPIREIWVGPGRHNELAKCAYAARKTWISGCNRR